MGKKFSRLVILLVAAIVVFHLGIVRSEDAAGSANTGLPQLQEVKTYKIPSSKTSTGIAGLVLGDAPTAVAWSPDGKEIAAFSSYGQNLTVWNVDGSIIKVLHPVINYLHNSLTFLNDDEILTPPEGARTDEASGHLAFNIWGISNGAVIKKVDGPEPGKSWGANNPEAYAISPDGSMIAMLSQQAGLGKLRTNANEPITDDMNAFQENPVPIYSAKTWEIMQKIPVFVPLSVAFSPDGKQIAFGTSRTQIAIYDTVTWTLIKSIQACENDSTTVGTIAYSPDGRFIVAGMTTYTAEPNSCSVFALFASLMERL